MPKLALRAGYVCSAHAGMSPTSTWAALCGHCLFRARGDEPNYVEGLLFREVSVPRTRG